MGYVLLWSTRLDPAFAMENRWRFRLGPIPTTRVPTNCCSSHLPFAWKTVIVWQWLAPISANYNISETWKDRFINRHQCGNGRTKLIMLTTKAVTSWGQWYGAMLILRVSQYPKIETFLILKGRLPLWSKLFWAIHLSNVEVSWNGGSPSSHPIYLRL